MIVISQVFIPVAVLARTVLTFVLLPVLGWLFKYRDLSGSKINLLGVCFEFPIT